MVLDLCPNRRLWVGFTGVRPATLVVLAVFGSPRVTSAYRVSRSLYREPGPTRLGTGSRGRSGVSGPPRYDSSLTPPRRRREARRRGGPCPRTSERLCRTYEGRGDTPTGGSRPPLLGIKHPLCRSRQWSKTCLEYCFSCMTPRHVNWKKGASSMVIMTDTSVSVPVPYAGDVWVGR